MPPAPEFSRLIRVESLKESPKFFEIEASSMECAALAERFSLLCVDQLSANFHLFPQKKGMIRLEGHIYAKVTEACVVTLEPLESLIEASFKQLHGGTPEDTNKEVEYSNEDEEIPVPFIDGTMDLGEISAEVLALELEPFPRKPGVEFKEIKAEEESHEATGSKNRPFAGLAALLEDKEK